MFKMILIGVDVGGTFTDLILVFTKTNEQYIHKVPSTPESQDIAVIKGVIEILETPSGGGWGPPPTERLQV